MREVGRRPTNSILSTVEINFSKMSKESSSFYTFCKSFHSLTINSKCFWFNSFWFKGANMSFLTPPPPTHLLPAAWAMQKKGRFNFIIKSRATYTYIWGLPAGRWMWGGGSVERRSGRFNLPARTPHDQTPLFCTMLKAWSRKGGGGGSWGRGGGGGKGDNFFFNIK